MTKLFNKHLFLIGCLLAVFILRAVTLEALSLMDPTESRYAFIAAEMVSSGDWITPMLPYPEGVIPYLGKPPLHFWLTAASISMFGGDEWCVRLPSFLALIVICFSLFSLFRRESVELGIIASLLAASSALLYFFAGSSVIDVTLAAFVTLAIVSYILCSQYNALRPWQWVFFSALGLGFLTKGPVAIVITVLPLIGWHLLDKTRRIPALPWKRGLLLMVSIPLPWFILSEIRNPGFTWYFFVQENFLRYISHSYGDRYGSGHKHIYGSVWWMFAAGLLPWTPFLLIQLRRSRKQFAQRNFLLDLGAVWTAGICFFFTFIRQLHSGYIIPAIPGAAILITSLLIHEDVRTTLKTYLKYITPLMVIISTGMLVANYFLNRTGEQENFLLCFPVGCFTFFAFYLFEKERRLNSFLSYRELAVSMVVLVSFYSTTNLSLASYIGDRSSAEGILNYVTANDQLALSEVSTITRNTFSHYYYGKEWKDELSHAVHMKYFDPLLLTKNIPTNIIVSAKELKQIPLELQQKYTQRQTIGNWIWLAKKTVNILHRS